MLNRTALLGLISAVALGLPPLARLWSIELPMASPMILAGIKTTAVITVGYAALGGLVAAGGYGQPIMTGLRLYDVPKMMEGAVPAAVRYERLGSHRWRVSRADGSLEFDVDEYGLALDIDGRFHRQS